MPQKPPDDLFASNDKTPDDLFVSDEPKDTTFLDSISSHIPDSVKSGWHFANKPLSDYLTDSAGQRYFDPHAAANYYDVPDDTDWRIPFTGGATWKGLGAGMLEGAGDVISGFTSPLNLATMGSLKGAGSLAETAPTVARGLGLTGRALSVPVAAEGAYKTATAKNLPEFGFGLAQTAAGIAGTQAYPEVRPPKPARTPGDIYGDLNPAELEELQNTLNRASNASTVKSLPAELPPPEQGGLPSKPFDRRKSVMDYQNLLDKGVEESQPKGVVEQLESEIPPDMLESMQVEGGTEGPNASGESAASAEALSRLKGMKERGEQFVVFDRAGRKRVLPGPEGVDYNPQGGETYGIETPRGIVVLQDNGGNVVGKKMGGRREYPGFKGVANEELPHKQAAEFGAAEQPKAKFDNLSDWVSDLIKGESGEADPNAITDFFRGRRTEPTQSHSGGEFDFEEPQLNRDIADIDRRVSEYRPASGRYRPSEGRDIRWDAETESYFDRGSPNWETVDPADITPEEMSRAEGIHTGRIKDPTEIREAKPYSKTGKTLEEVEAAKKQPSSERLKRLIGEDRANQLTSGEKKIEFNEKPERGRIRSKEKRLDETTISAWSKFARDQIELSAHDPSRPGISQEKPEWWAKNSFEFTYRDESGKPIGVMRSDVDGKGISTLAVSPDIGLRRGKVAFELLKQAFDRGVTEPSGETSDLTKNLIDRVKRLIKSESGEFNPDAVYDAINKLFDSIANSKVGKAVTGFLRDESGAANLDRLKELFEKQKSSELTPEEIDEARQIALEHKWGNRQPAGGIRPKAPVPGQLIGPDQLNPNIPIQGRKVRDIPKASMLSEIYNAPRGLMSIDLPFMTSAAFRQASPLAWTGNWLKAWTKAARAYGSEAASKAMREDIMNSKYFQPRYEARTNAAGEVVRYVERPSYAEEVGLKTTDLNHLTSREESIASGLAEKIPGYGRMVRASNRAYTAFLNDLRKNTFEKLIEQGKAMGNDPEQNLVLGKELASFINNATGRGELKIGVGNKNINLEQASSMLTNALFSPRLMASRIKFLNPSTYMQASPQVRVEYLKGLARSTGTWWALAGLAELAGAAVSKDPNNADFGKIRIGNTRIDAGAGFQQYLVLLSRMRPNALGGGFTSSVSGKSTPFGVGYKPRTRLSTVQEFAANKLHPTARLAYDLMNASSDKPFSLGDELVQRVIPMMVTDIVQASKDSPELAALVGALSSVGMGTQTYEPGRFQDSVYVPRGLDIQYFGR